MASQSSAWPRRLALLLVVLVVIVTVVILLIDHIALSIARSQAAQLGQRLGRPVEVGGVVAKLIPPFGVQVTDVRIGAAAGETEPLLDLSRAEVRVSGLRALLSLGKDIEIERAAIRGLTLNVVRLADGTTNLERLARAAASQPAGPPAPTASAPADLSFLRIDEAQLSDARVAFRDPAAGSKELAIDHIEFSMRDLRAGYPLDATLRAALLAPQQNLEVHLHAAKLPPTLRPTPEQLTFKMSPVGLDPLAPFLPKSAGFLGGRLEADLTLALGSLVPGGQGSTLVRGGFALHDLRLSNQEGGKPIDVALDADVDGDAAKGDLRIGKLSLTAGPIAITGVGRISGLTGDAPRVEALRVDARGVDPRLLATYYPPLRAMVGERVEGPIGLELSASGDASRPGIEARVDFTPVRLAFPGTMSKAAGAPLVAMATVSFAQKGSLSLKTHVDLSGVDLRPAGMIAKRPGDRLAADLEVDRRTQGSRQDFEIKRLAILLLNDTLSAHGTASVEQQGGARSIRFDLSAESPQLDLDAILLPAQPSPPVSPQAKPSSPAPTLEGVQGSVAVAVKEIIYRRASFRDMRVRLALQDNLITVAEARLAGLGGQLSADGSTVHLGPQKPAHLMMKAAGVDVAQVLALFTPRKLLTGRLDAGADLSVQGTSGREVSSSLNGSLSGDLHDGAFLGKNLVAEVIGPLGKVLPFAAAKKSPEGGGTSLGKDVPFSVHIANGTAHIDKPLRIEAQGAEITMQTGEVHLDGTLDLPLAVALSPGTIGELSGGRAHSSQPVSVDLRVTGPAWDPHVADLNLQPAVAAIAKSAGLSTLGRAIGLGGSPSPGSAAGAAKGAAQDAKTKAEDQAKKALQGILGH